MNVLMTTLRLCGASAAITEASAVPQRTERRDVGLVSLIGGAPADDATAKGGGVLGFRAPMLGFS